RRNGFRGRADKNYAIVVRHRTQRGRAGTIPDQVGVALVLEDRHAVRFRQAQDFRTPRFTHDGRGRVLHGRNRVDVFGADASVAQLVDCGLEVFAAESVAVDGNTDNV